MFSDLLLQIMQNALKMSVSARILLEIQKNLTSCAMHFATTCMKANLDSLLLCITFVVATF